MCSLKEVRFSQATYLKNIRLFLGIVMASLERSSHLPSVASSILS